MRAAFLCYLTQAWTADRYPQAQRDAPAWAASQARHSRPSPRASRYPAIGGQPRAGLPQHGSGPRPWAAAVSGLAEAANVKQIAASLPEGDLRSQLETRAAQSIDAMLDDWCGTRRPWPGPPPSAIAIAAEVAAMADSHQAGFLRDELLRIAGQALLRPFGRRLN